MEELFQNTLTFMEGALNHLAKQVTPPKRLPYKDSFVYRYKEQSVLQAIVQKLARMVSCLHSARVLSEYGLFQDQAALQRMLDEFHEDILFLIYGLTSDKITPLHESYLKEFYEEEFDHENSSLESTQKRGMVPRKKIRAYISKIEGKDLDPSRAVEVSRTLGKAYSGYIHGASPHIMEMYGGNPPHYHVSGMLGTPREDKHRCDLWHYFYRGILSFGFASKAFGDQVLFEKVIEFRNHLEAGKNKGVNPRQ